MGYILYKQSKTHESICIYQQSSEISKNISNSKELTLSLYGIANSYTSLKQFDLANEIYSQATKLAREIGVRSYLTTILNNHAALYLKTGNLAEALKLNQEALAIARAIKVPDDIFAAEYLQAQIVAATNTDQAIELLKKMLDYYQTIKEQSRILYQLTKLPKDAKIQKQAIRLIKRQIRNTDNPEYAEMLNEIEKI